MTEFATGNNVRRVMKSAMLCGVPEICVSEVFSCANSVAPKKYHLSLMIGPPSEPPQLRRWNGGFSFAGPPKNGGGGGVPPRGGGARVPPLRVLGEKVA